jgi:hypothetical protein
MLKAMKSATVNPLPLGERSPTIANGVAEGTSRGGPPEATDNRLSEEQLWQEERKRREQRLAPGRDRLAAIEEQRKNTSARWKEEVEANSAEMSRLAERARSLREHADSTDPRTFSEMNDLIRESTRIKNRLHNDLEPNKYRACMEAALQSERLQVFRKYPELADSPQEAIQREQREREEFDRRNDPNYWLARMKIAPDSSLAESRLATIGQAAIPGLASALKDDDYKVRHKAALLLQQMRYDPRQLVKVLLADLRPSGTPDDERTRIEGEINDLLTQRTHQIEKVQTGRDLLQAASKKKEKTAEEVVEASNTRKEVAESSRKIEKLDRAAAELRKRWADGGASLNRRASAAATLGKMGNDAAAAARALAIVYKCDTEPARSSACEALTAVDAEMAAKVIEVAAPPQVSAGSQSAPRPLSKPHPAAKNGQPPHPKIKRANPVQSY